MERVNRIWNHPLWRQTLRELEDAEQDRIFCRHGLSHLLDVARMAYIENLEQGWNIPKEQIYAAALLHDIGRDVQYQQGIPHELAGIPIAKVILQDCGFLEGEQQNILSAIGGHRNRDIKTAETLAGLIYRADKLSRNCSFCPASPQCNWPEEKKNQNLCG